MNWNQNSDLDFTMTDDVSELITFEDGAANSEADTVPLTAGQTYNLRTGCWLGTDQGYNIVIEWEASADGSDAVDGTVDTTDGTDETDGLDGEGGPATDAMDVSDATDGSSDAMDGGSDAMDDGSDAMDDGSDAMDDSVDATDSADG